MTLGTRCSLLLLVLAFLGACQDNSSAPPPAEQRVPPQAASAPQELVGSWRVTGKSLCPGMCADIESFSGAWKGLVLTFGPSVASILAGAEPKACTAPQYERRELTFEQFAEDFRFEASELGITKAPIVQVTITCANDTSFGGPGATFFAQNGQTVFSLFDGNFIELHHE